MFNRFEEIYEQNEWGHGSGEGSLVIHTKGYKTFLEGFLSRNHIKTVVEMGCGDWQFSRYIDWKGAKYVGYDVVPSVVQMNTSAFANENVDFKLYSGNPAELPQADLLIVKDVLQHLPNQLVHDFLPSLKKFRHALITNCTNPIDASDVNHDIEVGAFRYLDLRLPPFNLEASLAYTFSKVDVGLKAKYATWKRGHPEWRKLTLLVQNTD